MKLQLVIIAALLVLGSSLANADEHHGHRTSKKMVVQMVSHDTLEMCKSTRCDPGSLCGMRNSTSTVCTTDQCCCEGDIPDKQIPAGERVRCANLNNGIFEERFDTKLYSQMGEFKCCHQG